MSERFDMGFKKNSAIESDKNMDPLLLKSSQHNKEEVFQLQRKD